MMGLVGVTCSLEKKVPVELLESSTAQHIFRKELLTEPLESLEKKTKHAGQPESRAYITLDTRGHQNTCWARSTAIDSLLRQRA